MAVQPDIARLKSQLMITGLQRKDNPLFQVINGLIRYVEQFQLATQEEISSGGGGGDNITNIQNNIISFGDGDGGGGDDGPPGPRGSDGIAGATGPMGPMGAIIFPPDAEDGDIFPPIVGPQGNPGPTGAQGPLGLSILVEDGLDGEDGAPGPAGAGSSGAYTKIEEQTPTGSSVTFSSLGAYTHLEIIWSARGNNAALSTNLLLTFNGDTGNNYYRQLLQGSATAASASEALATASALISDVAAATAPAGMVGSGVLRIFDYRGTTFNKSGVSNRNLTRGTTSGTLFSSQLVFTWNSTVAITSITIALAAGNFVSGSKFSLYGIQ